MTSFAECRSIIKNAFTYEDLIAGGFSGEQAFEIITILYKFDCVKECEKGKYALCVDIERSINVLESGDDTVASADKFEKGLVALSIKAESEAGIGFDLHGLSGNSIYEIIEAEKNNFDFSPLFVNPYGAALFKKGVPIAKQSSFFEIVTEQKQYSISGDEPMCNIDIIRDLFHNGKDIRIIVGLFCMYEV